MNFLDETVQKVSKVLSWHPERGNCDCAKAALSSLTLQDLMQVDEVRSLVEAAINAVVFCRKLDLLRPDEKRLSEALIPFMEVK